MATKHIIVIILLLISCMAQLIIYWLSCSLNRANQAKNLINNPVPQVAYLKMFQNTRSLVAMNKDQHVKVDIVVLLMQHNMAMHIQLLSGNVHSCPLSESPLKILFLMV